MKSPANRIYAPTLQRFNVLAVLFLALAFSAPLRAQMLPAGILATHSVSGQFTVTGARQVSPLARLPAVTTNAEFIQLEPALLAVSAERVRDSLWDQLGVSGRWHGDIFLALHPARSLDENVAIVSTPFAGRWNYHVELPDIASRTRIARALTAAVLLELANRDNPGVRSAEIPAWLVDGLSQQMLATAMGRVILTAPDKAVNHILENRIIADPRGVDPLAQARAVLQQFPPLTIDELSWPADAQLTGDDGGVYRASAQLFVSGLLELKDGAKNMRAFLQALPGCYNWQTAFRAAFRADFPEPLDLEKWWALQTVSFASRGAGPAWTPAISRDTLDDMLKVPVEMRFGTNSLPMHIEISLQGVIRTFTPAQQTEVLQAKVRELNAAQLRMAPALAVLNDAYRRALAEYLNGGNSAPPATRWRSRAPDAVMQAGARDTMDKLDALDAQRLKLEAAILPDTAAE